MGTRMTLGALLKGDFSFKKKLIYVYIYLFICVNIYVYIYINVNIYILYIFIYIYIFLSPYPYDMTYHTHHPCLLFFSGSSISSSSFAHIQLLHQFNDNVSDSRVSSILGNKQGW